MLTRILSYHQVDPVYLDFLFAFGTQIDPLDQIFGGFCGRIPFEATLSSREADLAGLGRSSQRLHLSYNLKTVAADSPSGTDISAMRWGIRQLAVHHQFDFVSGKTVWVLAREGTDIQSRIQGLTGIDDDPKGRAFSSLSNSFRASMSPHLLYAHWAVENWRWYMWWAEQLFASSVCAFQTLLLSHYTVSFLPSAFHTL